MPRVPDGDDAGANGNHELGGPAAAGRVVRGGLVRVGGYALGALATVAASAIVIRHLGTIDTGRFVTVTTLASIAGGVSDLGLTTIGIREYSVRDAEDGHHYLRNLLGMRVALAVAGSAIAGLFAVIARYDPVMIEGTFIAGVGIVLFAVQQNLTIPLQVRLQFGWVTGLLLIFQWGVAATAAFLAARGAGLTPFFAIQIPILVVLVPLTVILSGRDGNALPAVDIAVWRHTLLKIIPYSAAVILAALYFRVAQILVSLIASSVESGYFGVSYRVLEALIAVPPLLVSTAFPLLSRMALSDDDRFRSAGRRVGDTMLVAGFGVSLTLFLAAEFVIDVIAGSEFGPSVPILRVLAVALIGTFVTAGRGYLLLSLGEMRPMLLANLAALIVVLAAGIPLIAMYGPIGAAVSLVMAEFVLAIGYEVALSRHRPGLRVTARLLGVVTGAAFLGAIPALVFGLPSLVGAVVGVFIYLGVLMATGDSPIKMRHVLSGFPTR